jgi:Zn-dependent M28 family amino/carboxypeptidase
MQNQLKLNLENHLNQIAIQRDPYLATGGHLLIKEYIRQEFAQVGVVETQHFNANGRVYDNLILNLNSNPANSHQPVLLITAHYDSVIGSPGADDNATGVAVLLELAKYFSTQTTRFPLRLIAFDFEEFALLGSKAYVELLQQLRQKVRLMLNLEMLGYCDARPGSQRYPPGLSSFYPSTGNFIALVGNLRTIPDLIQIRRHLRQAGALCEWLPVPFAGHIVPDTRRSDHASFWDAGYSAILVTDTSNLRNPNYHTANDTVATLDLEFLTAVCQGLIGAIAHL